MNMKHFNIMGGGSIVLLAPISEVAKAWVKDNVAIEEWQWLGDTFACEPRMVNAILDGFTKMYSE